MTKSREIAIQICELVENLLDEYNVIINEEERKKYMEDMNEDEKEEIARLFGSAYYSLEDSITEIIETLIK